MSDTLYIAEHNPITFLKLVEDAILDGLYADDSVASYPYFNGLNEITVRRQDKPVQRHEMKSLETVYVNSYENVAFILDVQDAILQGFEIVGADLTVPFTAKLVKRVPAKLDLAPVAEAVQAEEQATEAPVEAAKGKPQRKTKSKGA